MNKILYKGKISFFIKIKVLFFKEVNLIMKRKEKDIYTFQSVKEETVISVKKTKKDNKKALIYSSDNLLYSLILFLITIYLNMYSTFNYSNIVFSSIFLFFPVFLAILKEYKKDFKKDFVIYGIMLILTIPIYFYNYDIKIIFYMLLSYFLMFSICEYYEFYNNNIYAYEDIEKKHILFLFKEK